MSEAHHPEKKLFLHAPEVLEQTLVSRVAAAACLELLMLSAKQVKRWTNRTACAQSEGWGRLSCP